MLRLDGIGLRMSASNRFAGRRAVVTGGGAGIGRAVAARLAAEGATVCLWDMDKAALTAAAAEMGAKETCQVDVADPEAVDAAMASSAAAMGGLDILVCSAGITGPNTTVSDYPVEAWRRVMDVNLNGLFYCNRAAVPVMQRGGYGRIVNVASIAGKEGNPNASAYSASKAGVIGLTKSLGKELAGTEIRVNCVTPAAVRTAIFEQMTQQHIDFMLSKIPLGRFGTIDEVAALICWLASEEASFSTGAVFDVSGGRATY
ncbi:SDR family NAD(P)-dependent oxidoreductase [Pseudoroseomonas ludipueritiae]